MRTNPNFTYNNVSYIDSIRDLMQQAVAEAGDRLAFMYKRSNQVVEITYNQFNDDIEALGAALTDLGMHTAHIACIGENRYEWLVTYLTALQSTGVFVPLDHELPDEDFLFLLKESESSIVFHTEKRAELLRKNRDQLPGVRWFVNFDAAVSDGDFLAYSALIEQGRTMDKAAYRAQRSDPHALKDLVYTSGTTGVAKGVMLSEHNIVSGIYYGMMVSTIYTRSLSVLPYHHTYAAVPEILVSLHKHCTICINDSLFAVLKNLQLFKPDYIYLVPTFAELFYAKINKTIREQGKTRIFRLMIRLCRLLRKCGIDLRRRVFKSIHNNFGGNIRKIVCGGAPIRPEIGQFFDDIGMPLIGGYGITECSPLVCVNPDSFNDWNTAGCPLPCIDWKIDQPNEDGIGEILVKGNIVMLGYYKQPERTAEVLKDGWFYTGDYGYITDKDQLVITGRKKNIIVLANGKNVYPEELEHKIMYIDAVQEVVVRGEKDAAGNQTSLSAEVYLVPETQMSEADLLAAVKTVLAEQPHYKQISRVTIRDTEFPKTSSKKIKR